MRLSGFSGRKQPAKQKLKSMKIIPKIVMAGALVLPLATNGLAQTNLQFTAATSTDEQAIRLVWASQPNHVYQIQCADALATNANGSTAWQILYDDYPSQGTNTFWLDTGNYNLAPAITHPKNSPTRFYQILDNGLDDLISDEPTVSIVAPTSGSVVSGSLTITVAASTDQPVLSTKLYVDGQQMPSSDDGSNYVINTCEWGNGSHIIFATAICASGLGDALNGPTIMFGHAVSAFVPVTFSNLISRISFSQAFFNPDAGQTQEVTAVFAANCDWSLNIVDINSNTVRTTTGSGISMLVNWDGTDNSGTNVPAGTYYYYISAQTNGQAFPNSSSGGNSDGGSEGLLLPSLAGLSDVGSSRELWAVSADLSGGPVPLALYPPGVDTSGLTIFAASPSEIQSLRPSVSRTSFSAMNSVGSFSTADSGGGGYSGSSSQNASAAPSRPPASPAVRVAGLFGIAYQDYFPEMLTVPAPLNGLYQLKVYIQNSTQDSKLPRLEDNEAEDFIATMARGAWQPGFVKENSQLRASDLRSASFGGANAFNNNVSFGLVSLHGAYGTSQDYTSGANGAQQIYLAVDGRPSSAASWVRMSEMNLGSPGTNGLKWMVLACCNSLRQQNWNSIRNAGWVPFNQNLHLLLGANSIMDAGNFKIFPKKMLGLDGQQRETIEQAWFDSGAYCSGTTPPIYFAITGHNDCEQDMLTGTNSYTPQGGIFYKTQQVK